MILDLLTLAPWTVMEHPRVFIVFAVFVYADLPARPDLIIIIAPDNYRAKGKSEHTGRPGNG